MRGFEAGFDELYQQVLTWDVYDLIEGTQLYQLSKIAISYPSVDAYLDSFEPLLLEEARAQLERARQDERIRTHKLRLLSVEKRGIFYNAHFERPPSLAPEPMADDVVVQPPVSVGPQPPAGALGPTIAPSAANDLQLELGGREYYDSDLVLISWDPLDAGLQPLKPQPAARDAETAEGAEGAEAEEEELGHKADGEEAEADSPAAEAAAAPAASGEAGAEGEGEGGGLEGASAPEAGAPSAPAPPRSALKRQRFHCLGLVQRSGGGSGTLSVLLYLPHDKPTAMHAQTFKRLGEMSQAVLPPKGKRWNVRRIGNMITIHREWHALQAMAESPLAQQLLMPALSSKSEMRHLTVRTGARMHVPPALFRWITHPQHFNHSQKDAMLAALKQKGVTLIQGPPGTGKTATILGLLSVLLHARPRGSAANAESLGVDLSSSKPSAELTTTEAADLEASAAAKRAARVQLSMAAMPWLRPASRASDKSAALRAEPSPPPPGAADPSQASQALGCGFYPNVLNTSAHIVLSDSEHVKPAGLEGVAASTSAGARVASSRTGGARSGPARVLVCTPSNAAVDEIVRRLVTHGIRDADGAPFFPDVVRVGPNFAEDVRHRSLDVLARKKASEAESEPAMGVAAGARSGAAGAASGGRGVHGGFENARMAVLSSTQIVCTTLSCAGYALFEQLQRGFDTVLIDEAAQAVEVATLIPLRAGCERLILVGDPQQLPATVFSAHAAGAGYERSLFERLQLAGNRTHLLRRQYRMHPAISRFPAKHFYSGKLQDSREVHTSRTRDFHKLRLFSPYSFINVADGTTERTSSSSWRNESEARLVAMLVEYLLAKHPDVTGTGCEHIGVVTPYNGQVSLVKTMLRSRLGAEAVAKLDVHSVDGFQGREKEVVILSCVRAGRGAGGGIGFLKDARRLNVAITRAKSLLLVLGNVPTLSTDETWSAMIDDARARGCLIKATAPLERWFSHACTQLAEPEAGALEAAEPAEPGEPPEASAAAPSAGAGADLPAVKPLPKSKRTTRKADSGA